MAGTIFCAVCRKPVDRVVYYEDHLTLQLSVTAYCHGQKQEMRIGIFETSLDVMKQLADSDGVAFDQNLLG